MKELVGKTGFNQQICLDFVNQHSLDDADEHSKLIRQVINK
jgi:hypothetical protein